MKLRYKMILLLTSAAILIVIVLAQDKYGCNDPNTRDQCLLAYVDEEQKVAPALCEEITAVDTRDKCYFKLAEYLSDGSLCSQIETKDQGIYYHADSCFFNAALTLKNENFCTSISHEERQEICHRSLLLRGG